MRLKIAALFLCTALISPSLYAAPASTTKFSDSELVQMLKDEGYGSVKTSDGKIIVKIDGRSYFLFNNMGGDLQAYYGTSGVNISTKDINDWNRTKRLSRAYLDSDNDPVLEADLLSDGGLTKANVTEFFRIFYSVSAKAFREFVLERNATAK
ncbi:MAG: YbjN domain-containing protein [Zoogloea sp.]|nr:YbjN domain-containing protein [Zoogloea sp.]